MVVDGGAFAGDTSLYLAHLAGPRGRVHAFEFEPRNVELLETNLALNPEVARRVDVCQAALWDEDGALVGYRAITTDDVELGQRVRLMRAFGFYAYDAVGELGTNGKMNELSAAMGLTSLESLDGFIDASRRNYELYARELQHIEGLRLLRYEAEEQCNYHYIVIELETLLAIALTATS